MDLRSICSKIKKNIELGDVKDALTNFKVLVNELDHYELKKASILLSGTYRSVVFKNRLWLMSYEEKQIEINKISSTILDFIYSIESGEFIATYTSITPDSNKKEQKFKDPFSNYTNSYRKNLLDNNKYIKIFGMNSPVLLEDIFIRVNVLKKRPTRVYNKLQVYAA